MDQKYLTDSESLSLNIEATCLLLSSPRNFQYEIKTDKYNPYPSMILMFTSDSQHPPKSRHAVHLGGERERERERERGRGGREGEREDCFLALWHFLVILNCFIFYFCSDRIECRKPFVSESGCVKVFALLVNSKEYNKLTHCQRRLLSILIWIQTTLHSDSVPESFFCKKLILKKKVSSLKKYPACKKLKLSN